MLCRTEAETRGQTGPGLRPEGPCPDLTCRPCVCSLVRVRLYMTPWTTAHQAPLSVGSLRKDPWVGCHFLLQGIFPIQGLNPRLLHLLRW